MKEKFIKICCAIALSVNKAQIEQCERMIESFDKEFKYWSATLMLVKKLCVHERRVIHPLQIVDSVGVIR